MSEAVIVDHGRSESKTEIKPILLRVLIALLVFFLAAEVLFYMILVPVTTDIRLVVQGTTSVGYDELCTLAGISGHEKWFQFGTAAVASRLASHPVFESVTVEKIFPDRVSITVVERKAVAIAFGQINGRTVPLEIDRNGVAFRVGAPVAASSLPLITGLTFEHIVPGVRLNARLIPLLEQLSVLEESNPLLISSISEVKIEPKTYGGYDLVIFPVHTPIRVRMDKALNQDAIQYMMLVLDVVQDLKLDVEEIDIRAGTVAYRLKGEVL